MNPRFDLLTLQLLRKVDETGSVARAAETIHLTASAASKRILELESQLGIAHAGAQAGHLQSLPYTRTPLVLAVPAGHELAARDAVFYEETLRFPHIARAAGSALAQFSGQDGQGTRYPPAVSTQVTSFPAVFSLVSAGLGVAVVPAAPADWHVPANIRQVPLADDWASFELRLVVDPGVVPTPAVSRLLGALLSQAA